MNSIKKFILSFLFLSTTTLFFSSCAIMHPDGYSFHVHLDTTPQNVGRSQFLIHIMDKKTGVDVPGVNVTVQPIMPDMGHATPVESVVDNHDGSYTATVYYVMPGSWAINIFVDGQKIGQEPAFAVGGNMMMDKGRLKGITGNDEVYGTNRYYHIFKKSIIAGTPGSDSIDLFLATFEDMTTFPIVYSGQILHNDTGVKTAGAWTIGTVILSVCNSWSGSACTGWSDLKEDLTHRGHFSASGVTIANTGTMMMPTFAVHLHESTTNEWKTTDGTAGAGTGNGSTEFQNIKQ